MIKKKKRKGKKSEITIALTYLGTDQVDRQQMSFVLTHYRHLMIEIQSLNGTIFIPSCKLPDGRT